MLAYAEMVELVDTLRLERSAVRCAGSSPVLGKSQKYAYTQIDTCVFFCISKNTCQPVLKHKSRFWAYYVV